MAGTESAYILDLLTEDTQHCNDVVKSFSNFSSIENFSVLLLTSGSSSQLDLVKTALDRQNHDKIVKFENKDKIAVFYEAKLFLDKHGISVFSVLCSNRHAKYWHLLLECLITNVYEWQIITVDHQDVEMFTEKQITEEVSNFFGSQMSAFGDVNLLTSPIIPTDLFYHGFSCRTGGLSSIPGMKSLNLVFSHSKRDPKALVQENRRKLAKYGGFDPERFNVARAVHGNNVLLVGEQESEGYDGIATDQLGTTLGAPGADCVTMLFADPVKRACAALHSGWMGTVKRACVEVIHKMATSFGTDPADICVVMGPSIGQCCFEFDADKIGQFKDIVDEAAVVNDDGRKAFVNLHLCNRVLLEQSGVKPQNIDDKSCTKCTSCNQELFFSYRRDGRPFGNQLGFIGMRSGN